MYNANLFHEIPVKILAKIYVTLSNVIKGF